MIQKILCWLGLHNWQYCYAPYPTPMGMGKIRARVCRSCPYKDPHGDLIMEETISSEELKIARETEEWANGKDNQKTN